MLRLGTRVGKPAPAAGNQEAGHPEAGVAAAKRATGRALVSRGRA
jgi:hypothetical protein